MGNHEARVESTLVDQEGRQLAEGGVAQPLHPPLADGRQLVDRNAQEVQSLGERRRGQKEGNVAWKKGEEGQPCIP